MPHLINTQTLCLESLTRFPAKYAILSHTWGSEEMTYQDMAMRNSQFFLRSRKRCKKLQFSMQLAKMLGHDYLWIDTCCVDRSSTADLSEAVNSMHDYYRNSDLCIAYLEDVKSREDLPGARWFTRGWTLMELIFSPRIEFYGADGAYIGSKKSLLNDLAAITGIDAGVLTGKVNIQDLSVARRMSWLAGRTTARPEDMAYCMLGIFGLTMDILYGEGDKAFLRLQSLLLSQNGDQSLLAWNGPPSRWGAIADSPNVFADSCSVDVADDFELTTRTHVKTDLNRFGLRATLVCWLADPSDWRIWYAVLENSCSAHPEQPLHVIKLRQLHPRRPHFVRVSSESHIVFGDSLEALQEKIIFEEETRHNKRLMKELPSCHEGVCTDVAWPAPDYPSIESDPWQMDLLNDDDGNRFYRADISPRYRDIVIRFTDGIPSQSDSVPQRSNSTTTRPGTATRPDSATTQSDSAPSQPEPTPEGSMSEETKEEFESCINQEPVVKFEPERQASFNKIRHAQGSGEGSSLVRYEKKPNLDERMIKLTAQVFENVKTMYDESGFVVEDDWFLLVDRQGPSVSGYGSRWGFMNKIRNTLTRK